MLSFSFVSFISGAKIRKISETVVRFRDFLHFFSFLFGTLLSHDGVDHLKNVADVHLVVAVGIGCFLIEMLRWFAIHVVDDLHDIGNV